MMAAYFAMKIIEGKSYESIFRVSVYKQFQEETNAILVLEGYEKLIPQAN